MILALVTGWLGCGDNDEPLEPGVVGACDACLATGKSFSGAQCVTTCLQDTYCFGPANPAALTCPRDPAAYTDGAF